MMRMILLASICLLLVSCAADTHPQAAPEPWPTPWCGTSAVLQQMDIENRIEAARAELLVANLYVQESAMPVEDKDRAAKAIDTAIDHLTKLALLLKPEEERANGELAQTRAQRDAEHR